MPPVLRGSLVSLRPVEDDDAQARRAAGHVPELDRLYGGAGNPAEPYGLGQARRWVAKVRSREPLSWVIDLDGRAIGEIYLHGSDTEGRGSCYASLAIFRPDCWSLGYGSDALGAVLAWAFSEGGREMVFLRVREDNVRALRCYARAGFREGRRNAGGLVLLLRKTEWNAP